MTTPRANQERRGNEETGTSPFTPKLSLPLSCALLPLFFSPATALSLSFSPDLSMPKIHRMKEERGREGGERGEKGGRKEEDPNQKSLSIQTDGKRATWDLFVNNR